MVYVTVSISKAKEEDFLSHLWHIRHQALDKAVSLCMASVSNFLSSGSKHEQVYTLTVVSHFEDLSIMKWHLA